MGPTMSGALHVGMSEAATGGTGFVIISIPFFPLFCPCLDFDREKNHGLQKIVLFEHCLCWWEAEACSLTSDFGVSSVLRHEKISPVLQWMGPRYSVGGAAYGVHFILKIPRRLVIGGFQDFCLIRNRRKVVQSCMGCSYP